MDTLQPLLNVLPFSPPDSDVLTILFEWANKVTDLVIAFYLTNPRTLFAIIICTIFAFYYIRNVVQKPLLFCSEGRFKWFLKANCPTIQEEYWPPFWCYETHLLTPIANFLRGLLPELKYHREYIITPDGGQISLDWYDPDGNAQECDPTFDGGRCNSTLHSDHDRPIALFLPGLTGCSQAEYIKTLVPIAHRLGYRAVAINYRGLGNTRLLTPRLYCAANDDDLRTALRHIRRTNPQTKVVATGVSLGGIILARYLIQSGHDALVDAAFLVSVCWDFTRGCASMERGLNYALNQHLTRALVEIVVSNRELFESIPNFDLETIRQCRDIREFDEAFTIRMFNFESVNSYYCESSHKGKIACIKKPTFCINAADDMFSPAESLPVDEMEQSSHVAMLVTSRGGHIGFMDGILPKFNCIYYSERVIEQYLEALYKLPNIQQDLL